MEKAAGFLSSLLGGGEEVPPEPAATVRSILIYPIKSCRGISVPQAPITSTGTCRSSSPKIKNLSSELARSGLWWMVAASIDRQGSGGIGSGWWWTPRGGPTRRGWSPSSRWWRWRCRRRHSPRSGGRPPIPTWVFLPSPSIISSFTTTSVYAICWLISVKQSEECLANAVFPSSVLITFELL